MRVRVRVRGRARVRVGAPTWVGIVAEQKGLRRPGGDEGGHVRS